MIISAPCSVDNCDVCPEGFTFRAESIGKDRPRVWWIVQCEHECHTTKAIDERLEALQEAAP